MPQNNSKYRELKPPGQRSNLALSPPKGCKLCGAQSSNQKKYLINNL